MSDDLRAPFLAAQDALETTIDRLLAPLTDEQLADLDHLFTLNRQLPNGTWTGGRLGEVPPYYWRLAPKVRAHVHREQRRRIAAAKETTPA